jgi:hypothetical protein
VHESIVGNGALSGNEGLREHLPAEHPAERHPLAGAGEDVFTRASSGVCQI